MGEPGRITSVTNRRVKAVVRLRVGRERRASGLLVAEGLREVERAVRAGLVLRQWFACPGLLGQRWSQLQALLAGGGWQAASKQNADGQTGDRQAASGRPADVDVDGYEVSEAVLVKMAYRSRPEGVLAVFEQPAWGLEGLECKAGSLWLVAQSLTKPGNLGALARTVSAAGGAGLLVADAVVDAFNPNAIRASTGAVFTLPVVCADGDAIGNWLAERQVRVFAADPGGELDHTQAAFGDEPGRPVAIAVGAEDAGLSPRWAELANRTGGASVRIAMVESAVDSLNASVAAGVLLFEAVRQRRQ